LTGYFLDGSADQVLDLGVIQAQRFDHFLVEHPSAPEGDGAKRQFLHARGSYLADRHHEQLGAERAGNLGRDGYAPARQRHYQGQHDVA
jgi:hypothetical protein